MDYKALLTHFVSKPSLTHNMSIEDNVAVKSQLQSMEHTLTEERKFSPAIAHAFNQLQFVDFPLNHSVVLGKRETCHHCGFVAFNTQNKALEFADLAGSDFLKPGVELFTSASTQHLCKLLNQGVGQICFWMALAKLANRLLLLSI